MQGSIKLIERALHFALYAIVVVVPSLYFSGFYFPFVTTKVLAFRTLVVLMAGLFALLLYYNPKFRVRPSALLFALAGFLSILVITSALGENPLRSFWSSLSRMEGVVMHVHLFAYFLIAGALFSSKKEWETLFKTIVWVNVAVGFFSLLFWFSLGGEERLGGFLGNPSYYGIALLFYFFIALLLLVKNRISWKLYAGASSFFAFLILLTASRAAVLGILIGLLVCAAGFFITNYRAVRLRHVALVFAGIFLVLASALVFLQWQGRESIVSRFENTDIHELVKEPRFLVWQVAWAGIQEKPLLGWGIENFPLVFSAHYDPRLSLQEGIFDRAHNAPLDWLVAGGLPLLFFYLAIFATALWLVWKAPNDEGVSSRIVITGLLAAYFVHNLFSFDSPVSYILFMTILAYLHARYSSERAHAKVRRLRSAGTIPVSVMSLLVLFLSALFIMGGNGIAFADSVSLARATRSNGEAALRDYVAVIERNGIGSEYAIRELVDRAPLFTDPKESTQSLSQTYATATELALTSKIEQEPNSYEWNYYMGKILYHANRQNEALLFAENARQYAPNRKDSYRLLGQIYEALGRTSESVALYESLYQMEMVFDVSDPDFAYYVDRALTEYAAALIRDGRAEKAEALLRERFGSELRIDDALINAYVITKNWKQAILLWKARVDSEPNDPQSNFSLAAVQYAAGETGTALATLRAFGNTHPLFREETETYIRYIQEGRRINVQ